MTILTTAGWHDYELLDSGEGYRLEKFGQFIISKPDPQAIWKRSLLQTEWDKADAIFAKKDGKEGWVTKRALPDKWPLTYKKLSFYAKLTPFKHTGLFPEQHLHWDFITDLIIKSNRPLKVLNLFGYTGIASIAAASAGAQVTHVDASRPAIGWARENQELSGLINKPIRWILDDVIRFVEKEVRRGNSYEGIIMDPPVYGHGPKGEVWDFSKSFPELMNLCSRLLSKQPVFLIVNAYAISSSSLMLENVMKDYLREGNVEAGELTLQEKTSRRLLSTGIFARWSAENPRNS